jgi:hypothetical protein
VSENAHRTPVFRVTALPARRALSAEDALGVNVNLGAFALRDAKSFPNMSASNDTMREIAKALRHHVDTATLEKVVNELAGTGENGRDIC